ncbi:YciI family protein [Streptomyces albipurpureus]|uniref:YciI family protein n=1 Tax=Streptomyces albipurpureus TaxID=2897419 RepID=A0ABT0UF72_9ACTN|nr:YciI family protein [Streptomyces sp. CWNU-1]MCM2387253.1 YciI family protein [Streptomyces sp. CWNU-1]
MTATAPGPTADSLRKQFFVIFSDPGPRPQELVGQIPAHLKYLTGLEKRGALLMSGPFLDTSGEPGPSGMLIVRATSTEEAAVLAAGDPFHSSGARTFRVEEWQVHQGRIDIAVDFSDRSYHLR